MNDSSNLTQCLNSEQLYSYIGASAQLIITLAGVTANFLLIIAHVKDPLKTLKASSSPFIVNIAAIDLIMSFTLLANSLLTMTKSGCSSSQLVADKKPISILLVVFGTVSFPSFFILSIERFCSVAFPLWHRVRITTRVCRYWLCAVWLVHLIFVALNFALIADIKDRRRTEIGYVGIFFVLTHLFYLGTYLSLKNQRKKLLTEENVTEAAVRAIRIRLENEKNFLTTVAIVCSILAVTLLPRMLAYVLIDGGILPDIWETLTKISPTLPIAITWATMVLLSINFAINPLVLVWRLRKYRKTFKKIYCKSLGHLN